MSHHQPRSVRILIGNTYKRLEEDSAPLDRSGSNRKVHDWTLFVDVVGNAAEAADLIEMVTFDLGASFQPSEFVCNSPVPLNGRLRFSTRQQTYGLVTADIKIRGTGGTLQKVAHTIQSVPSSPTREISFVEHHAPRPLRMVKLPKETQFGLELELTSAMHLTPAEIASCISTSETGTVHVMETYRAGRVPVDTWKLVPDSSIVCNPSQPDCNTFELVSPILRGGNGLSQTNRILLRLSAVSNEVKVNRSMGFHVHVDVSGYNIRQLVKICQNYIKYEDVMDSIMPPSRRTGSDQSNRYFQSNRRSVGSRLTNTQRLEELGGCRNLETLAHLMNANGDRFYKLNLQNLVTGRQPTLEFRQHSATTNYQKVSAWVRFCTAFVRQSARLAEPGPLSKGRSLVQQLDALFLYVIKDRALRNFYRLRQNELRQGRDGDEDMEPCCERCRGGGGCQLNLGQRTAKRQRS